MLLYNHFHKSTNPLLSLPSELLFQILCQLSPRDISRFSQTNSIAQSFGQAEELWRRLVKALYLRHQRDRSNANITLDMFGSDATWYNVGKWLFQNSCYLGWWASNRPDTGRLVKCSIVLPPSPSNSPDTPSASSTSNDNKTRYLHPPLILAEHIKPIDILSAQPHLFRAPTQSTPNPSTDSTDGGNTTSSYISVEPTPAITTTPEDPSSLYNSRLFDQWSDFVNQGAVTQSLAALDDNLRGDIDLNNTQSFQTQFQSQQQFNAYFPFQGNSQRGLDADMGVRMGGVGMNMDMGMGMGGMNMFGPAPTLPDTGKYAFPFVLPKKTTLENNKKNAYNIRVPGTGGVQLISVDIPLITWSHRTLFMIVPPTTSYPKYPAGTHLLMSLPPSLLSPSAPAFLSSFPVSLSLKPETSVWFTGRQKQSSILGMSMGMFGSSSQSKMDRDTFPTCQLAGRRAENDNSALRSLVDWRYHAVGEMNGEEGDEENIENKKPIKGKWIPQDDGNSLTVGCFQIFPPPRNEEVSANGRGEEELKNGMLARVVRGFKILDNSFRGRAQMVGIVDGLGISREMWANDMTWPIGELFYPLKPPASPTSLPTGFKACNVEGLWTGTYGPHGIEVGHISLRTLITTRTEEVEIGDGAFSVASDWPNEDLPITRTVTTKQRILQYTKVTGDVNVPRGQVSWYAILEEGEEENLPSIKKMDLQRFVDNKIAADIWNRTKIAGKGQLAYPGFGEPTFVDVDVTFMRTECEDTVDELTVWWYDLRKVSRFKRIIL